MGQIPVGTASWTDRTLIGSGWYPPDADTPGAAAAVLRLPVPAGRSRRHLLRAARRADRRGLGRPSPGRVHLQRQGVQPVHPAPCRTAALPADPRPAEKTGKDRIYLKDVESGVADAAWDRFLAALEPLCQAGKLGAILLQFPPWFTISHANKEYILSCAQRALPRRVCAEFRNRTWMTPGNQDETLEFLAAHQLPYVCATCLRATRAPSPRVLAATAPDLARLHGHSTKWASTNNHERFGYRYTDDELTAWAPKICALAQDAEVTHVLFNNCYRDYAQANAQQLAALLLT